ncbi:MAG: hypothetical protein ACOCP5_02645 [Halanaerobiaceae bacterium]
MIEVHPEPSRALSDGSQSIKSKNFSSMIGRLKKIARAVDKDI